MPWKAISAMDQKREFIQLALAGGVSISELCRRFGISRQTGHQLLRRHAAQGEGGLVERSRRPHASPARTAEAMEMLIVRLRAAHPAWGGRKLRRRLQDLGHEGVPSASTITEILRRHGLLDATETQQHQPWCRFTHEESNALWQMDFKGHFATDAGRCHPLTVLDDHSRYALGVRALADETRVSVQRELTALFRRYGLPRRILADNGSPWGSAGSTGSFARLEVWMMLLGVELCHGRPYHPQTQGKDERFHRTLGCEVIQHRHFRDLSACQAAFDAWRAIYNEQRPHEALGMAVPATRYKVSERAMPNQITPPEYASDVEVRRVRDDGYFSFKGKKMKISQAFAGYQIGLRQTPCDGIWDVLFSSSIVSQINLHEVKTDEEPLARYG